ncbi:MAG: hypothetical protein V4805_11730 [Pseudomonadota bacterium]
MKKYIGVLLSLLVILAVAAGAYKSFSSKKTVETGKPGVFFDITPQQKTVKLLTGSAKFAFLKDPALAAILQKQGITLDLVKSGAFEQDQAKVGELDAAWPAGANVAADWSGLMKGSATYPIFSTPLAIASWKALMPVFEKNGIAKMSGPTHGDFYLEKSLPLMLNATRWNQLKDNDVFNFNKSFLVNTPDLRKSNTGALYIAALAYIQNGNEVPQDIAKAEAMAEKLSPLITRQGFQEGTLAGPFEDYIGQGMGKAPLVLIYESQFIEAKRGGKLSDKHILLYPQPGLVLKHVFVGKSEAGKKLGELLSTNPEIQKIAAQYGFRTNDPAVFNAEAKALGLDAPELLNLAESPSTAIFNAMNQTIIQKLESK